MGPGFRRDDVGCSLEWNKRLGGRGSGFGLLLLGDLALQAAGLEAEAVVLRLQKPIVEPANMLDRAQAVHRDAQLDPAAQGLADQGHVLQIGQEGALGLVVGVGNVVAHLPALAGQLANARHDLSSWFEAAPFKRTRKAGADSGAGRFRQPGRGVKAIVAGVQPNRLQSVVARSWEGQPMLRALLLIIALIIILAIGAVWLGLVDLNQTQNAQA